MLKKRENFNLLDEYAPPLKGRRRQHTRSKAFSLVRQRNFAPSSEQPKNHHFTKNGTHNQSDEVAVADVIGVLMP